MINRKPSQMREEFAEPFVGKNVSFTADFTGTMGVVGVR